MGLGVTRGCIYVYTDGFQPEKKKKE